MKAEDLTSADLEALATTTRLARQIAATIPADALPTTGEWYGIDATLLPDPNGPIEIDGVRYRHASTRVTGKNPHTIIVDDPERRLRESHGRKE